MNHLDDGMMNGLNTTYISDISDKEIDGKWIQYSPGKETFYEILFN